MLALPDPRITIHKNILYHMVSQGMS